MKTLKTDFIKIVQKERGVLILMIFNLLLAIFLTVFSIINLNPDIPVVKVSYGDIGGYRDGTWIDMLSYPLLAVIFGIVHNFLALRIFHKRGSGMAKFFLLTTTMLIVGTFFVLLRTLGEG